MARNKGLCDRRLARRGWRFQKLAGLSVGFQQLLHLDSQGGVAATGFFDVSGALSRFGDFDGGQKDVSFIHDLVPRLIHAQISSHTRTGFREFTESTVCRSVAFFPGQVRQKMEKFFFSTGITKSRRGCG